ncbi:MAG: hypothetical protein AABY18_06560 [Candidatus Thermoplasmatota archaeon]
MNRPRWLGPALVAGGFLALAVLAFALKWPLLHTVPYGDEHTHFALARDHEDPTPGYRDVWGNPNGVPLATFWQRPAFYVAFHIPATFGFDEFRITQALVASLLAPLGAALVRAHGGSRVAAAGAGIALAVGPPFVLWGAYAFMDVLMMVAFLAFLLARHARRWRTSAALAILAVWTKETAYAGLVVLFAIDLVRTMRAGRASLYPLSLGEREASLAWAIVIAPLPLAWAIAGGLLPPGGVAYGNLADIVGLLLPSIWLLPLLALGLAFPRSRFLSAAGVASFLAFVVLHLSGRAVESWYAVPSLVFGILGCASAADALVRAATSRGLGLRIASVGPGLAAFALCLAFAFLPAGKARDAMDPLGEPSANLDEVYHYETQVRGQDLVAALAEVPLDRHVDVLMAQNGWPLPWVQLESAGTVYLDFAGFRGTVGFSVHALAERIENATTWTLVGPGQDPMQKAIPDVYGDCHVATHGDWKVFYGATCAGREEDLRIANHAYGGP